MLPFLGSRAKAVVAAVAAARSRFVKTARGVVNFPNYPKRIVCKKEIVWPYGFTD